MAKCEKMVCKTINLIMKLKLISVNTVQDNMHTNRIYQLTITIRSQNVILTTKLKRKYKIMKKIFF